MGGVDLTRSAVEVRELLPHGIGRIIDHHRGGRIMRHDFHRRGLMITRVKSRAGKHPEKQGGHEAVEREGH
jgi:hypothetical protein